MAAVLNEPVSRTIRICGHGVMEKCMRTWSCRPGLLLLLLCLALSLERGVSDQCTAVSTPEACAVAEGCGWCSAPSYEKCVDRSSAPQKCWSCDGSFGGEIVDDACGECGGTAMTVMFINILCSRAMS